MFGRSSTYDERKSYFPVVSTDTARAYDSRFTPCSFAPINSFARSSIHFVAVVSAGPPDGGLYLKPPSSGGLCDGVITMPSARAAFGSALCVRMACDSDGVG